MMQKPDFTKTFRNSFGQYKGSSIFLILSGPSVTKSVRQRLNHKHILKMGVNNSPLLVLPNLWVCVDPPDHFLGSIWRSPTIQKFIPSIYMPRYFWDCNTQKLSNIKIKDLPNIFAYDYTNNLHVDNPKVFWGTGLLKALPDIGDANNSVSRNVAPAAIDICLKLGFKNIYLVGADGFRLRNRLHGYNLEFQLPQSRYDSSMCVYSFLDTYYMSIKDTLDTLGVSIYNCSRSSLHTHIPYKPLNKCIKAYEKAINHPNTLEKIHRYTDGIEDKSKEDIRNIQLESEPIFKQTNDILDSILNGDFKLPEAVNESYRSYNTVECVLNVKSSTGSLPLSRYGSFRNASLTDNIIVPDAVIKKCEEALNRILNS